MGRDKDWVIREDAGEQQRQQMREIKASSVNRCSLWFWQDGEVIDEWEVDDGFVPVPNVGELVNYHRGSHPEGLYRKNSATQYVLGRVVQREFEFHNDFYPEALHAHQHWQIIHLFMEFVDAVEMRHMR